MPVVAHTVFLLLGYAAFLVAFVAGLLFLIQDTQLKHKHMGLLFHRLPALGTLDRVNFFAIGAGFALFTLGVALGLRDSHRLMGSWWRWDSTGLLTAVLWVSYLALWIVRLRSTLRGRKVAVLSMLGFVFAVFTFFGVSHWLPTWHAAA